jgi:hypothetical protein
MIAATQSPRAFLLLARSAYLRPRGCSRRATSRYRSEAARLQATNSFDLERLMVTFAEDALVNDQLRDYWGKPAITEWAKRDIIGERLTMNVTKVINHYGNFIVTADVDGNYDKRGLPDPMVLAFYFSARSDLIVQLIILRNRHDI